MTELNSKKTSLKSSKIALPSAIYQIKNIIKNIFSSRIFLAILFLTMGVVITNSCQKKSYHEPRFFYHSYFKNDEDFFNEFDEIHYRMEKAMQQHRKAMEKAFSQEFDTDQVSGSKASLRQLEDEKFYNYELQISGLNPQDINVLFENGYLIFSSNKTDIVNNQNQDKTLQSANSSSFYYATNLPDYDEKITPEIIKTNDKISVKLTKKIINNISKTNKNKPVKK